MCKDVETLVYAYVKCRDHLAEERKTFKAIEVAHKKDMAAFAQQIMALADEHKVESFKTAHGTAYKSTKDFINVRNWDLTLDFILENDLKHLLTKNVTKAAVKEFMAENNNELPPGLEYRTLVEINVRRK